MTRRSLTPTFTIELPLSASAADGREALIRLELGRQLYNAGLGEALRSLDLIRQSLAWARACALPKTVGKKPNPARRAAFLAVNHSHQFTSDAISAFATRCKNVAKWNNGRSRTDPRLGAHETQRIAEKAFSAVEQYAFGLRGRPRFKGKSRPLHSLEGKSAESGLRWNASAECLIWGNLCFRAQLPPAGKNTPATRWLTEALTCRTKYARLVWRIINGKRRWFVQLAQEGTSPAKRKVGRADTIVGIDVGPSTVAVYSEKAVALVPLATEVTQPWAVMKQIQRKMDRSRRATNPHCYNKNGTWRRGAKVTVRSVGYETLRMQLSELERVLAATRKRSHGRLVNQILAISPTIHAENLSYVAFQKSFGRSAKVRASGMFMSELRRKAESAGGKLRNLNTQCLKLSQLDHPTGTFTKKPLSQRWHSLGDRSGVVQRDMYSAFLAFCVESTPDGQDVLHPSRAAEAWPVAQSLLGRAGWGSNTELVSVARQRATTVGVNVLPPSEPVARQRTLVRRDAAEVVGVSREPQRGTKYGLRTPLPLGMG